MCGIPGYDIDEERRIASQPLLSSDYLWTPGYGYAIHENTMARRDLALSRVYDRDTFVP